MKIIKLTASLLGATLFLGALSACGGTPTAEELAARTVGDDASKWTAEDYKTIAAKSCIRYHDAFKKSLGDEFLDWDSQLISYTNVKLESGALAGNEKWGAIAEAVNDIYQNVMDRSIGGSGVTVPSDTALKAYDLCKELGVDINS
jgi:hypothetical protein